jgi:hypothetical protein
MPEEIVVRRAISNEHGHFVGWCDETMSLPTDAERAARIAWERESAGDVEPVVARAAAPSPATVLQFHPREIARLAAHEAGHCVAARAAGYKVERVQIGERNWSGGHGDTHVDVDEAPGPRLSDVLAKVAPVLLGTAQCAALVLLAGGVAETLLAGSPEVSLHAEDLGDNHDIARALARLRRKVGVQGHALAANEAEAVRQLARKLLTSNRGNAMLRATAARLEDKRTLTGEELEDVLRTF